MFWPAEISPPTINLCFLIIHFNLLFKLKFLKWSYSLSIKISICYTVLISAMHAACFVRLVLFYYISSIWVKVSVTNPSLRHYTSTSLVSFMSPVFSLELFFQADLRVSDNGMLQLALSNFWTSSFIQCSEENISFENWICFSLLIKENISHRTRDIGSM